MSNKKLTLISSDGETFEIDETVALQSQTIKEMVEKGSANNTIALPKVTGVTLAKVIEYLKKHVEDNKENEDDLKKFDAEFVKVSQNVMFDLILAANYLNIKGLLDLTCKTFADVISRLPPEQICETFRLKNDSTPEEEGDSIENAWAYE